MQTVGELGESGVLRRVLAQLSPARAATVGPGDDSAVLGLDGDLVVTSDTMIEGPDFRLDWHRGFDLGWKLAATNLSDVAAMGARPIALTVALACPRETPVLLLEDIARGLNAACAELAPGCGVVGGDLGTAPVLTAAVTAMGDLEGRAPVLRSGAEPGDVIAYAGQLGLAGLGLAALFAGGPVVAAQTLPAAVAAQFAPRPPILAGIAAATSEAPHRATAMMDVSDGLSLDAARLAEASGVTLDFSGAQLAQGFGSQAGVAVSIEVMMTGGEDHGMLATFSPESALPAGFVVIGRVCESVEGAPVLLDGTPYEPRGWDPYAAGSVGSTG